MTTITIADARARGLMQTNIARLTTTDPVKEAVGVLEEYRIGGAPVFDEGGKLVGFFTLTDVARSEHFHGESLGERQPDFDIDVEDPGLGREDYSPDVLGRELVQDWMNPSVIYVGPDASLSEVCRTMVSEHIHRVVVIDGNKLCGILSSFDVVRFLAEVLPR